MLTFVGVRVYASAVEGGKVSDVSAMNGLVGCSVEDCARVVGIT